MKKLITILLIFLTFNGFSQHFALPGAIWHYSFSATFNDGVNRIFHDGDTLIQGVQAQKLQMRSSYTFWETGDTFIDVFAGYEYTYADQDHVYQLVGNEFKLLYDFTVQPNDTILIYNSENYDPSQHECDSVGRAIVTEIGTEIINGLELRWYIVETLEESTFILNGKIIERIGNTTGSLFSLPSDCIYIQEWIGQFLRCYEDDDFPQYKPYSGECDFVTGIDEFTSEQNFFSFYPNPASGVVNVSVVESVKVIKVRVYEVSGKVLLDQSPLIPLLQGGTISFNVNNLNPGMYLLELETKDGYREVKRLVVE